MNKNKIITALIFGSIIFGLSGSAILAQTATPEGAGTKLEMRESNLQNRATKEIDVRVDSLNKVISTLNGIKKISSSDRSALLTQIQTEISNLQSLQTKIQGDTDLTMLRTDVQSITKAFRVYWLFIPKVHILSAADRINETAALMQNFVNKLQARITADGSAASSLQATLTDASSKMADAQIQAQNAVSLVTALNPDNGDKNILEANIAALKSARTDIQTANQDLKTAYQDFKTIVQALKTLKQKPSPSPSV